MKVQYFSLLAFAALAAGSPVQSASSSQSKAAQTTSNVATTTKATSKDTPGPTQVKAASTPAAVKPSAATAPVGSDIYGADTSGFALTPQAQPEQLTLKCPGGCTWPALDVPPKPKPEWMALIANASIPDIPVVKMDANGNPINPGYSLTNDPYCSWSYTHCLADGDIAACPAGVWGLTYDDGPQPPGPALYNFLQQQQQHATLFIIGSRALEYPSALKKAYANGHQIALHTWSHPWLTTMTNEQIVGEMMWNAEVVNAITGITPLYMRPPHGDVDNRVRAIMKALGFKVILWQYDSQDWMAGVPGNGFQPDWISGNITQWAATKDPNSGPIVLEHELSNISVAQAMKSYNIVKQDGWKIQPIADCLGDKYYYKEQVNGSLPVSAAAANVSASASASTSGAYQLLPYKHSLAIALFTFLIFARFL
ncbi:hypothetical protein BZG36_05348 [Bifiguratus adelaidae]|uniref:NodB homology domain-containing protein n=1 Tax=Bifiguratus adelaidae TaxID=1938954 RepID=A0A261XVB3_9FUNG|nr:hypothetical protein BZG36_05348 [Bifiguratus adelaidae]